MPDIMLAVENEEMDRECEARQDHEQLKDEMKNRNDEETHGKV